MHKSPRGESPRIECLEQRIAPAALTFVNPQTASFIDANGSRAYVHVTKGVLTAGNFVLAPSGLGYQLETLDLSKTDFKSEFEDASVSIYAHATSTSGDLSENAGYINATGIDLGDVHITGDLGRIDAGDTDIHTAAIHGIRVLSMGELGATTQAPGGNLTSDIFGAVKAWTILGNFDQATIIASDTISHDSQASRIYHLDISGSIIGGSTEGSGSITAAGGFSRVDIRGDIIGGSTTDTGAIFSGRSITNLKVYGSLEGGDGDYSGAIDSPQIRHAKIYGDIIGGGGNYSGSIEGISVLSRTYGGAVRVLGEVAGGNGNNSGFISGANPATVVVDGNVTGGSGNDSGEIYAGRALAVRITGSLTGGDGADSGSVIVQTTLGGVHIDRDMIGGSGDYSGAIEAMGRHIGVVTINGSVAGGSPNPDDDAEAGIYSGSIVCALGGIDSVVVGNSITGGAGNDSATIQAGGSIGSVEVLHGGLTAGAGTATASILATKALTSLFIHGDVTGDAATGVRITGGAGNLVQSILIGGDLTVPLSIDIPVNDLRVNGSIYANDSVDQGALVAGVVNSILVQGDIVGAAGAPVNILLAGRTGAIGDALGELKVDGSVADANILAGYAPDTTGAVSPYQVVDPAARIGTVTVNRTWSASNLVAGVSAGNDGQFGTADDFTTNTSAIFSRIGRILIEGAAEGSGDPDQHFGFVAQEVAAVTVANFTYKLTPGPGNDTSTTDPNLQIGTTGNFTIHEVAPAAA